MSSSSGTPYEPGGDDSSETDVDIEMDGEKISDSSGKRRMNNGKSEQEPKKRRRDRDASPANHSMYISDEKHDIVEPISILRVHELCGFNKEPGSNCKCKKTPNPNCLRRSTKSVGIWDSKQTKIKKVLGPNPSEELRDPPEDMKASKKAKSGSKRGRNKSGVAIDRSLIPCGLQNLGATCYLNSLLQSLFQNRRFRQAIYAYECELLTQPSQDTDVPPQPVERDVALYQLQLLFARLQYSKLRAINPRSFVETLRLEIDEQQDANEFNSLLLNSINETLKRSLPPNEPTIIDQLFYGTTSMSTTCTKCKKSPGPRISHFMELQIQVKGMKTVQDCLSDYFKDEYLTGDNQYVCSNCNSKQDAVIEKQLANAPEVINLQLMRFHFDPKTNQRKKLHDSILLPQTIDLTRFVAGGAAKRPKRASPVSPKKKSPRKYPKKINGVKSPARGRKSPRFQSKRNLRTLTKEHANSISSSYSNLTARLNVLAEAEYAPNETQLHDSLQKLKKNVLANSNTFEDLQRVEVMDLSEDSDNNSPLSEDDSIMACEHKSPPDERKPAACDARVDLTESKEDPEAGPYIYQLSAVLRHRGSAVQRGHYTCDILNEKAGEWFLFNDDRIEKSKGQAGDSEDDEEEEYSYENSGEAKKKRRGAGSARKRRSGVSDSHTRNAYMLLYTRRGHAHVGTDPEPRDYIRQVVDCECVKLESSIEDYDRRQKERNDRVADRKAEYKKCSKMGVEPFPQIEDIEDEDEKCREQSSSSQNGPAMNGFPELSASPPDCRLISDFWWQRWAAGEPIDLNEQSASQQESPSISTQVEPNGTHESQQAASSESKVDVVDLGDSVENPPPRNIWFDAKVDNASILCGCGKVGPFKSMKRISVKAWEFLSKKYGYDHEFSPEDVCQRCLSKHVEKLRTDDDINKRSQLICRLTDEDYSEYYLKKGTGEEKATHLTTGFWIHGPTLTLLKKTCMAKDSKKSVFAEILPFNTDLNENLTCSHDNLYAKNSQSMKLVSLKVWSELKVMFPESREFPGITEPCSQCKSDRTQNLEEKRGLKNLRILTPTCSEDKFDDFPGLKPPRAILKGPMRIIQLEWLRTWRSYVNPPKGAVPGPGRKPSPMDPATLLCQHGKLKYCPRPKKNELPIDNTSDSGPLPGTPKFVIKIIPETEYVSLMQEVGCEAEMPRVQFQQICPQGSLENIVSREWDQLFLEITEPEICHPCTVERDKLEYEESLHFESATFSIVEVPFETPIADIDQREIRQETKYRLRERRATRSGKSASVKSVPVHDIKSTNTIQELKLRICQYIETGPNQLSLFFRGTPLSDDTKTVADHKIPEDAQIFVQVDRTQPIVYDCFGQDEAGPERGFAGTLLSSNVARVDWMCPTCTYKNTSERTKCEMCGGAYSNTVIIDE
eukprot:92978_1